VIVLPMMVAEPAFMMPPPNALKRPTTELPVIVLLDNRTLSAS
jgi:hypothetical protein